MFKDIYNKHIEELELIVPIVARVHGEAHPELAEVKVLFDELVANVDNDEFKKEELFTKMNTITDGFAIPSDACNTYASMYNALKEISETV